MKYETLTPERQQQLVEGQLNNLEAEHFNLTVQDEVRVAGGEEAAHAERLAALEKQIAVVKKRRTPTTKPAEAE